MRSTPPIPATPAGLKARGRNLWQEFNRDYELDRLEVEVLTELCRAVDRADRYETEIQKLKFLASSTTNGVWRAHPLLSTMENEAKLIDRLATSLGLSMPSADANKTRGPIQARSVQVRWARAAKAKASVTPIAGAQ